MQRSACIMLDESITHLFAHFKSLGTDARPHPRHDLGRISAHRSHRVLQYAAGKPAPTRMCRADGRSIARSEQNRHAIRDRYATNKGRRVAHDGVARSRRCTQWCVYRQRFSVMHVNAMDLINPANSRCLDGQRAGNEALIFSDRSAVIFRRITEI